MENIIDIEKLTTENVKQLTEQQAAELANAIESEPDKAKRSKCMNVLASGFDFRSVSSRSRAMKNNLSTVYGYKFFAIANDNTFVRGVRKRV